MRKWILISLAFIFLVPLVIYVSLPLLASKAVESWLLDQGFEEPRFNVDYPTNRNLLISELHVIKTTSDRRTTLDAGPITLSYKPLSLLLGGQFERIAIPEATLNVELFPTDERMQPEDNTPFSLDLTTLLPEFWIKRTPADEVLIGQLSTHVHLNKQPPLALIGNIYLHEQQLYSRFMAHYDNQPVARADLMVTPDNHFTFKLLHNDEAVMDIDGAAIADDRIIQITAHHNTNLAKAHELLWQFPGTLAQVIPGFTGALKGKSELSVADTLTDNTTDWMQALKFIDNSQINVVALSPINMIKLINFDGEVETHITNKQGLSVNLSPKSSITALNLGDNQWHIDKLNVQLQSAVNIHSFNNTMIAPFTLSLATEGVNIDEIKISNAPILLDIQSINLDKQEVSSHFSVQNFNIETSTLTLPPIDGSGSFTLHPDNVRLNYLLVNEPLDLDVTGDLSYETSKTLLKTHWRLKELSTTGLPSKWRKYLPFKWPADFEIENGFYSQTGQLSLWGGTLDGAINHAIRDMHIKLGKLNIKGIDAQSTTFLRDKRIDEQGSITISEVEQGFIANNIRTNYRINQLTSDNPIIDVTALSGQLLGGDVKASPFYTTLNDLNIRSYISLNELSLDEILKLENQPGLSGEGVLSGHLPVVYHNGQFSVKDGNINASKPGMIRYEPSDEIKQMSKSNPGLDIALNALSNFHFTTLNADVDYAPDGALELKTALAGANPDWNKGQPINFTINIEENLIKLMKSLQFTDRLTEQLQHTKKQ